MGASPTITASVKNLGCANIVSLAHFPIPGVKLRFMIEEVLVVNGYVKDGKDISSTIRSVYGKCGFDCVFVSTEHGITGITEIYG